LRKTSVKIRNFRQFFALDYQGVTKKCVKTLGILTKILKKNKKTQNLFLNFANFSQ